MKLVHELYFPLQPSKDVAFEIGRIFMGLKDFSSAAELFRCVGDGIEPFLNTSRVTLPENPTILSAEDSRRSFVVEEFFFRNPEPT